MSEFQYYGFQAIDKPLTDRQMAELRDLSTRAHITSTSFVNTYQWGDFKGRPDVLMEKYFDAFIYFANWGTRIFKFRVPLRLVNLEALSHYCRGHGALLKTTQDHAVFSFCHDREPDGNWDEDGGGIMESLIPIRESVLDGDWRALYLGWLLCVQQDQIKDNDVEPTVPAGLASLTRSARAFADFLCIDQDLISAAAQASSPEDPSAPHLDDLKGWIQALPSSEKDDILLRLVGQGELHLKAEVLRKYREAAGPRLQVTASGAGRPAREILDAAAQRRTARLREAAEQAEKERQRVAAMRAAAREKYLDELAGREAETWATVDSLIARKPARYEQAVELLRDLGELSRRSNRASEYNERVLRLREAHSKKSAFISRLNRAGVGRQ